MGHSTMNRRHAATVLTPLAERDHRNTRVPSQLLQGLLRGAARRRAAQHLQRLVLRIDGNKGDDSRSKWALRSMISSS